MTYKTYKTYKIFLIRLMRLIRRKTGTGRFKCPVLPVPG